MTKLKLMLMAILAIFTRLFALPTSAARRGDFNLLRVLLRRPLPNFRWLAACLLSATLVLSGCGSTDEKPPESDTSPLFKLFDAVEEKCGDLPSANTCEKAKDYFRCVGWLSIDSDMEKGIVQPAKDNVEIECGDEDDEKGKPFQQVCPEGAACNQGVQ